MFQKLALLMFVFLSPFKALSGGVVANNGGGLAEQNILFAWVSLNTFWDACVSEKECGLTIPEQKVLIDIKQDYAAELKGAGIKFLSGAENPGVFELDGQGLPRTAVTGDKVGYPIYFNTDRLYPVVNGVSSALDILTAVSLLVHELGHHQGIKDHTFLDKLGGKIKAYAAKQAEAIDLKKFGQPLFRVEAYNPYQDTYFMASSFESGVTARLTIKNQHQVFDFSKEVLATATCPEPSKPESSRIESLSWKKLDNFEVEKGSQPIKFTLDFTWSCTAHFIYTKRFASTLTASADFSVKVNAGNFVKVNLIDPNFTPKDWRLRDNSVLTLNADKTLALERSDCSEVNSQFISIGPCF
jgi:hypothetical protein